MFSENGLLYRQGNDLKSHIVRFQIQSIVNEAMARRFYVQIRVQKFNDGANTCRKECIISLILTSIKLLID